MYAWGKPFLGVGSGRIMGRPIRVASLQKIRTLGKLFHRTNENCRNTGYRCSGRGMANYCVGWTLFVTSSKTSIDFALAKIGTKGSVSLAAILTN